MNRYRDIIALPHPVSQKHARMSARNRAAQFAPFAALTGFDGVIAEAERTADGKEQSLTREKARDKQLTTNL